MPIIDCYGQLGPQPFPTKATRPDALQELMVRFGVDMTFVAATEALRGSMKAGNAWLAEQIQRSCEISWILRGESADARGVAS